MSPAMEIATVGAERDRAARRLHGAHERRVHQRRRRAAGAATGTSPASIRPVQLLPDAPTHKVVDGQAQAEQGQFGALTMEASTSSTVLPSGAPRPAPIDATAPAVGMARNPPNKHRDGPRHGEGDGLSRREVLLHLASDRLDKSARSTPRGPSRHPARLRGGVREHAGHGLEAVRRRGPRASVRSASRSVRSVTTARKPRPSCATSDCAASIHAARDHVRVNDRVHALDGDEVASTPVIASTTCGSAGSTPDTRSVISVPPSSFSARTCDARSLSEPGIVGAPVVTRCDTLSPNRTAPARSRALSAGPTRATVRRGWRATRRTRARRTRAPASHPPRAACQIPRAPGPDVRPTSSTRHRRVGGRA